VTQFQVEVANQIGFFMQDVPKDLRDKKAWQIVWAFTKYLIAAYIFNDLFEKLTGRRPALDPIGIVNKAVGNYSGYALPNVADITVSLAQGKGLDFSAYKMTPGTATVNLAGDVAEEIPFIGGLLGGGRIPMSSAMPDFESVIMSLTSDQPKKKKVQTVAGEIQKPIVYGLLPGGGGQIAKTVKGIKAVNEGGKRTVNSKGEEQLQYPITPSVGSYIQAGVFGPTATPGGQRWVSTNFSTTLSPKETKAYDAAVEAGLDQDEAYDIVTEVTSHKLKADKVKAISDSAVPQSAKRALYYNLIASDHEKMKFSVAEKYGVPSDDVIDILLTGEDMTTVEKVEASLRSASISRRDKAVVIQVLTNCKNNPYNTSIGKQIYNDMNEEE
jgi:hypothetical protein